MTGKSILVALLFSFATFTQLFAQCDCVTTGNCPVPITDYGVYSGFLDVTVNGANDLGVNPLTSVCVTITHTWIGDLSISLTSPSGVEYLVMADAGNNYFECGTQQDNAEICIVPGTSNPLTNNTQYLCNQGPCSVGTCCLRGNWTVPCGGVTSPVTGWPQAPNCDLNDFNVPGDPANGTWTLSILDVCNQDVGNLENFSLTFLNGQSCYACESDGGTLDSIAIIGCVGDSSLIFDLPPNYGTNGPLYGNDSAIYDYVWVLVQNDIILSILQSPNFSTQPPGNYEIYGLSYLTIHGNQLSSIIGMNIDDIDAQLESSTAPFCADFSANFIPVTVLPAIPPTVLNTTLCAGECVIVGGQSVCSTSSLTLSSWHGCDSIVQVNLTFIQPDTVNYVATVCGNNCTTIGGQQYCPPTAQYIHLQTWQNCDSVVHLTFNQISPTAIILPANPPAITCTNSSVTLDASTSGPGTLTYAWSGPALFSSIQAIITASSAGTYTVTVSDHSLTPACTSTASVTVADGVVQPALVLSGATPSLCLGDSFNLATVTVIDNNNTGATITYHSGTPATAANQLPSPIVSPTATTTYYFKATIGTCKNEIGLTVIVNPIPDANFTATPQICITNAATVTYTGTVVAGAIYTWNFGGGTATPGTGIGPHTVTFATPGTKTITLSVKKNACTSPVFSQNIIVDSPLAQPVITCQATTTSVLFSWPDVPNSTGYNVSSSVPGSQISTTSYEVTGLAPGQSVTLTVQAIGTGACGNSSASQTCSAQSCPPVTVTPTPVADICLNTSTTPFNLQATVTGSTGGTLTWSGTGIVNAAAGTFDPSQASLGANTITATYTLNGCTDSNTLTINVFSTPTASLSATPTVCAGSAATVTFAGTTGAGINYVWDFDGGTATPGIGAGPHNVVWASPGSHSVSVTVSNANNCTAAPATASVQVDTPLAQPTINCIATTQSVTFTWPDVAGATSYNVNVTTGQAFIQNSATSYTVNGLSPGEAVSISVTAVSGNICANSAATADCAADPCPTVSLAINPVADICLNASTTPFNLQATVTGSTGGTLTWSGTGIVNAAAGTFDPSQASLGANTITATYTLNGCTDSNTLTINVFPTPTASLSATPTVCAGSAATVTFAGTTGAGINYVWDFDGGTATPGIGAGPQTVVWSTPGTHVVSVTVSNANGCMAATSTVDVQVDAPLAQPAINCSSTSQSVTFTWPDVAGATSYTVNVTTGQSFTQNSSTSYIVNGLTPGEVVSISVTAVSGNTCANSMATTDCASIPCPTVSLTIDPVADICREASTQPIQLVANVTGGSPSGVLEWFGQGVTISGLFDPNQATLGANTITAIYTEGPCNTTKDIIITVNQTPGGGFSYPLTACVGTNIVVNYTGALLPSMTYNWDFGGGTSVPGTGAGPHNVSWSTPGLKFITLTVVSPQGCVSSIFTGMVTVDAAISAPQINCTNTTTSIEFTWPSVPGATGYTVTTSTGQIGTQTTPTTYLVTGLQPTEQVCVTVTAVSGNACPNASAQLCCNAKPCSILSVNVAPVPDFCLGTSTPIQLLATVTGSDGTGTGTWSGPGIVNPTTGTFSATAAGFGQHVVVYTFVENGCTYTDSETIGVYKQPTSDFTLDAAICLDNFATVTYSGVAGANAVYTWDFGGGTANPGIGKGPHQVQWNSPGLKTVTLTVTDGSCTSSIFTQQIQVDDELETPVINCSATTNSVTFTWNSVPNATGYTVAVTSGSGGMQTSDTSYVFNGLNPLQQAGIQVTVQGNTGCPLPVVTASCNALPCPVFTVDIQPVGPYCLTAASIPVQLVANVNGVGLAGTGTWSGVGVVDALQGIFDPAVAGVGSHQISYKYQQVNCSYDDQISIKVLPPPTADAGPDRLITCWESDQIVQLGGSGTSGSQDINYLWTAASGSFPGTDNIRNPQVGISGLFTLTVTNTALGCASSDDVLVMSTQSSPDPEVTVDQTFCGNGGKDANITVSNVTGGMDPYLYSLNGEPFVSGNVFPFLEAGDYELTVMDAEGCTGTAAFQVEEAGTLAVDLTANLVGQAVVKYGESIQLTAITSLPASILDSIAWTPSSFLSCTDCFDPLATPVVPTTFTVTVFKNGCVESDSLTVFVDLGESQVYVPTAFSPNDDGTNDLFRIYTGPTVTRVKTFFVFDRWGGMVYQYEDFDPKDPARGWNGKLDGKPMNPAVFVWFAEIEFVDGSTKVLEGEVTLMR